MMMRTLECGIGAMLVHELGHIMAAELLGWPVKEVRIGWLGIAIVRSPGNPLSSLLISGAGPLINLLVAIAIAPFWKLFSLANFCIFFFNLIPIANSDGDRMWTCAARLGWIEDPKLPRKGLGAEHDWLRSRGYSSWDLEHMEVADEHPPAPGSGSLQKMEDRENTGIICHDQ